MARKARIHYPEAVYHVMLRGNGGNPIFSDEEDYHHFEALLQEGIQRFKHKIHGYCWMPNHVHLVIQVGEQSLSKIIQNLSFRYTRWFNRRQNQTGHLFQGRYKAILVDADEYLWELVRYVHLNPVRAGLVKRPDDFRWSGHLGYLGHVTQEWLTTDWVLRGFSKQRKRALQKYQDYILEGIGEERRVEFHQGNREGRLLGDDVFLESIIPQLKDAPKLPFPSIELGVLSVLLSEHFGIPLSQLKSAGRTRNEARIRILIALFYTEGGETLQEVAEYFQRDISTLSRQVNRLLKQMQNDPQTKKEVDILRKIITNTQA